MEWRPGPLIGLQCAIFERRFGARNLPWIWFKVTSFSLFWRLAWLARIPVIRLIAELRKRFWFFFCFLLHRFGEIGRVRAARLDFCACFIHEVRAPQISRLHLFLIPLFPLISSPLIFFFYSIMSPADRNNDIAKQDKISTFFPLDRSQIRRSK